MTHNNSARLACTSLALLIALVHAWAAFWFNRNADHPVQAALQQCVLFLFPLLPISLLVFFDRPYPMLFGMFYSLMALLIAAMLLSGDESWIFLVLQLPVLWISGAIAFSALFANKPR